VQVIVEVAHQTGGWGCTNLAGIITISVSSSLALRTSPAAHSGQTTKAPRSSTAREEGAMATLRRHEEQWPGFERTSSKRWRQGTQTRS
jgi:hypothetical protein